MALSPSLRFLLRHTQPFLGRYGLGLLFLFATNYITVRIPAVVGESINVLSAQGAAALAASRELSYELIAMALGLMVVRTCSRILFFNPGRDIEYGIVNALFGHMLTLQRPFYARRSVGELVSISTSDTQSVRLLVGFAGLQVCNVAFALPMHLWQMWQTAPQLTLYCLGPIALGSFYLYLTIRRFYGGIKATQAQLATLSASILESYSGVATLRSHAADAAALERFDRENQRYLDLQLRVSSIRSFSLPALAYSGFAAMGIVLWWGGQQVMGGSLLVGSLATLTTLLVSLVAVLTNLVWVLVAFSRGTVSLGRVHSIIQESANLPEVRATQVGAAAPHIRVENLDYCYPGSELKVLSNISLDLQAGKSLGLFGKTGSGKTTLLSLLARTYQPPDQKIRWNEEDINAFDLGELRKCLTVVPQDPFLFSATLRENLRMREDDASQGDCKDPYAGDALLAQVVQAACLDKDLEQLPQGLDTVVGERGVMLSGGQRQRTAFARALYRQPQLLLLDDVLSAVDQRTEAKMSAAIRELSTQGGKRPTTVIVSHRTRVLEHVDEILVLDDGCIVERGSHQELLALGGHYAQVHERQEKSESSEEVV